MSSLTISIEVVLTQEAAKRGAKKGASHQHANRSELTRARRQPCQSLATTVSAITDACGANPNQTSIRPLPPRRRSGATMHQPHLSLAFLHSHDFDELVPTLKLLLALLPALVALAYGVVRPKPQTPPRKAGALDKWRSALASLAVILLVARSIVGTGEIAALKRA